MREEKKCIAGKPVLKSLNDFEAILRKIRIANLEGNKETLDIYFSEFYAAVMKSDGDGYKMQSTAFTKIVRNQYAKIARSVTLIFTADSTFADKYPDGKRTEEKRIAFKSLPEKIREAIMEDILEADAKGAWPGGQLDVEGIEGQLNFSEYLSDSELKDLFTKEAQEKENAVEKDQEKPEKKKHKYRGR